MITIKGNSILHCYVVTLLVVNPFSHYMQTNEGKDKTAIL